MSGKIRTYRDLDIWKSGIQLVKDVYKLTEQFPKQDILRNTHDAIRDTRLWPNGITTKSWA
ncbi:MAG: four helix bundle protein [Phycisphaerae bacterium]|nr:four helix bundle protein [Phycisphaerae bacterium]